MVGVRHLELVEDAVQTALMAALTAWTDAGPARRPRRVALPGRLQPPDRRPAPEGAVGSGFSSRRPATVAGRTRIAGALRISPARCGTTCCGCSSSAATTPSRGNRRLVLALKTLCGFSTAEIALRLFTSRSQRAQAPGRARDRLREAPARRCETPPLETLRSRLPGVHAVLYLLFNEGYLSAHAEQAIRRELCDEAIRLATLLAEHPVGAVPETFALLALMHLHAARLGARVDGAGGLLLLEEQDRSLWDRERMQLGAEWLAARRPAARCSRASTPRPASPPSIASRRRSSETRWKEIADLYAMLERIAPSPLHTMNRAVAVAEWQGPEAGLAVLRGPGAARLAGRLLPLGRGAGRPASASREPRTRSAPPGAGAGVGAHGGGARAPPAPSRHARSLIDRAAVDRLSC